MKFHALAGIGAILLSYFLGLDRTEWVCIIIMIGLVLTAETFNSAIEKLADHLHPQYHPKIGLVKDLAAGAVLIISITAAVVGAIIFIAKAIPLIHFL